MPDHTVFAYLIHLLLAILEVSVQGSNKSPFETHSTNMWTFLMATVIYYFAFVSDKKSKSLQASNCGNTCYSKLNSPIAVISGSLSCASLLSIFPRSHGYMIFLTWAFVPSAIVYQNANYIEDAYDCLQQTIMSEYDWLQKKFKDVCDWLQQKIKHAYDWFCHNTKDAYDWLDQKIHDKVTKSLKKQTQRPPV